MNFGNACDGDEYFYNGIQKTGSFTNCRKLVPEIGPCQTAGKKIFISIGGDTKSSGLPDVQFQSQSEAVAFANQLWQIFGPYDPSYTGPRPFGTASVDGFDFDIESGNGAYFVDVANTLRSKFSSDPSGKTYQLSAAPQCLTNDIMAPMIQGAYFDYVWVQYYNTAQCSARAYFDQNDNGATIGWDTWSAALKNSANPNVPLFLGLPGSPDAAPSEPQDYLSIAEATTLINKYACSGNYPNPQFGGVMLYDATYALNNNNYGASIKAALSQCACFPKPSSTTTTTTVRRSP